MHHAGNTPICYAIIVNINAQALCVFATHLEDAFQSLVLILLCFLFLIKSQTAQMDMLIFKL